VKARKDQWARRDRKATKETKAMPDPRDFQEIAAQMALKVFKVRPAMTALQERSDQRVIEETLALLGQRVNEGNRD
jgi:hypothetical protein